MSLTFDEIWPSTFVPTRHTTIPASVYIKANMTGNDADLQAIQFLCNLVTKIFFGATFYPDFVHCPLDTSKYSNTRTVRRKDKALEDTPLLSDGPYIEEHLLCFVADLAIGRNALLEHKAYSLINKKPQLHPLAARRNTSTRDVPKRTDTSDGGRHTHTLIIVSIQRFLAILTSSPKVAFKA